MDPVAVAGAVDDPVDPVAPPARQIDAQQADLCPRPQRPGKRILRRKAGVQDQATRLRRGDEPLWPLKKRHPRAPLRISRRKHKKRQRREEVTVLAGHVIADEGPGGGRNLQRARAPLRGQFAGMKGAGICGHDRSPSARRCRADRWGQGGAGRQASCGDRGMPTNSGRASIRASHARSVG